MIYHSTIENEIQKQKCFHTRTSFIKLSIISYLIFFLLDINLNNQNYPTLFYPKQVLKLASATFAPHKSFFYQVLKHTIFKIIRGIFRVKLMPLKFYNIRGALNLYLLRIVRIKKFLFHFNPFFILT